MTRHLLAAADVYGIIDTLASRSTIRQCCSPNAAWSFSPEVNKDYEHGHFCGPLRQAGDGDRLKRRKTESEGLSATPASKWSMAALADRQRSTSRLFRQGARQRIKSKMPTTTSRRYASSPSVHSPRQLIPLHINDEAGIGRDRPEADTSTACLIIT